MPTKAQTVSSLVRRELGITNQVEPDWGHRRRDGCKTLRHGYGDHALLKQRLHEAIEKWTQQGLVLDVKQVEDWFFRMQRFVVTFDPYKVRQAPGQHKLAILMDNNVIAGESFWIYQGGS